MALQTKTDMYSIVLANKHVRDRPQGHYSALWLFRKFLWVMRTVWSLDSSKSLILSTLITLRLGHILVAPMTPNYTDHYLEWLSTIATLRYVASLQKLAQLAWWLHQPGLPLKEQKKTPTLGFFCGGYRRLFKNPQCNIKDFYSRFQTIQSEHKNI